MSNTLTLDDPAAIFLAAYLSWASKVRVYTTFLPCVSYRGHDCSDWQLLPSLCRQKPPTLPNGFLKQVEGEIIDQFRNRFQLSLPDWTDIDVLAYAQHHGAPTRLLDWSKNPLIALWFAISDKRWDLRDGVVFQLRIPHDYDVIHLSSGCALDHMDNCKSLAHIFSSPHRIDRTERQRSVFSITTFNENAALKPLDQLGESEKYLRNFSVPARLKVDIRLLLSLLALDAHSVYGDPDSFGKACAFHMDVSYFKSLSMENGTDKSTPPPN